MEKKALVKEIRNSEKARYIDIEVELEREGFVPKPIRATLEVYGSLVQETDWIEEGDVILVFWRQKGEGSGFGGVFEGAQPQDLKKPSKSKPKAA